MNTFNRRDAMLVTAAMLAPSVKAQTEFPAQTVKIVVPFSAGGPTDTLGRVVAERLSAIWKQAVIVDNKAGGGSVIGTNLVAKAPPDGYTVGMVVMAHVVNPLIRSDMPYDTLKDLSGVSQITTSACALVVHPSLPVNSVQELIALAKAKPGELTYATPGAGTLNHMAGELLKSRAGIDMLHVPYKGSSAAHADVLSGRVPVMFDVWAPVKEYVKAGKLKVLGITLRERMASEPNILTIAETIPGFEVTSAFGFVTSSKVPRTIIEKLGRDIAAVIHEPAVAQKIRDFGMEPVGSTPAAYDSFIRDEIARWGKVVKDANITVN